MTRFSLALAVVMVAGTIATAGPPISESKVHCRVLYEISAGWVVKPDRKDRLLNTADAWAVAAHCPAQREVKPDQASYVSLT